MKLTPVYPSKGQAPTQQSSSGLWLPPQYRAVRRAEDYQKTERGEQLVSERKGYNEQLLSLIYLQGGILDDWNRELEKIDPLLRLGQAVEDVPAGFPLVPGFYHLVRLNINAPFSVTPITGPNESFAVPTSRMLDKLREGDLQHRAAVEARRARMESRLRAEEAAKVRDRETRREELFDRYKAARETRISFSPEHKWTQNVSGRRGRRG